MLVVYILKTKVISVRMGYAICILCADCYLSLKSYTELENFYVRFIYKFVTIQVGKELFEL